MNLKNNIVRIFSANFLTLITSIIIGFVIPAIISVESYSNVKTFTFYLSYLGILHFGFVDGMYIKYGGKELCDIDKSKLKAEYKVFIVMEAIISITVLLIALITKKIIIFLIAISVIPVNLLQFYQLLYQATGEFKAYSRSVYIYSVINLILNILLAIVLKNEDFHMYCLAILISNIIACAVLTIRFYKDINKVTASYSKEIWQNIKSGFFILIGNLSVIIFLGIDRWFIKIFFDTYVFGYYSFAVSMLSIVNVLVTAISITFYNYLAKGEDKEKVRKLKKYFLILGSIASLGYFPLSAIVNIFLGKYIPSLKIIAISFASYPYMIVINALYVNLYKAGKCDKKYVKRVFQMVIVSLIYNVIAILVFKTPEAVAVATTIAFITWYLYSMKDFKYLKINLEEAIYLLTIFVTFIFLSNKSNWLIGGISYLIVIIIVNFIFCRYELLEMIKVFIRTKEEGNNI